MDLSCPVCLEEDKDGEWYQCDNGHPVCAVCYYMDVDVQIRRFGGSARCVLCRDVLKRGSPVICRAQMDAIAAKKAAARQEVQVALKEEEDLATAIALSVAAAGEKEEDEQAEAVAAALASQLDYEEVQQERARKRKQQDADQSMACDLARKDGTLDKHAHVEAQYEEKVKQQQEQQNVQKYSRKLQRAIANAPEADRVSCCSSIIEDLLNALSPPEKLLVLTRSQMAQESVTAADIQDMTVPKLKEALNQRGLDTNGRKRDLVARLQISML